MSFISLTWDMYGICTGYVRDKYEISIKHIVTDNKQKIPIFIGIRFIYSFL